MAAETREPESAPQPNVDQVVVVFKTHFDIGYTGLVPALRAGWLCLPFKGKGIEADLITPSWEARSRCKPLVVRDGAMEVQLTHFAPVSLILRPGG